VKPVDNPLKAPDYSSAKVDTDAGPNVKGVMSAKGAISDSRAFGTFGIPYTTTRVQEGNGPGVGATSANRLGTTYPYRTVGKLTFSAGYCSASLIRRSVIVTAAHCIQNFGSGGNTFSNFHPPWTLWRSRRDSSADRALRNLELGCLRTSGVLGQWYRRWLWRGPRQ
jgi:hypothetical protein